MFVSGVALHASSAGQGPCPPRKRPWRTRSAGAALGLLLLTAITAWGADDPGTLYRRAEALRAARNWGAAGLAYQRLLKTEPEHLLGRLALARLQVERAPGTALETLEPARSMFPASEELHWLRGRALEGLGRLSESAEAYRQVIRLNPRRVEANQRLRQVLRNRQGHLTRVDEAAQGFYAAPNLATLALFGRLLLDEATSAQALAELEDARRRVPGLPEIELWIARLQKRAGSTAGAIDAYQRFLAADPKAAGVRLLLAEHLQAMGRARRAAEILAAFEWDTPQLARLDSGQQARLAFVRGRIAMARNDVTGAVQGLGDAARLGLEPGMLRAAFQADLTILPEEPALWGAYARWLERVREPEQAVEAWLQAGLLDAKQRPSARQALIALQASVKAQASGGAGSTPADAATVALADRARMALARLALADGKPQEALQLAEAAPGTPAASSQRHLIRGLAYRALGKTSQGVDAFTAYVLTERDPGAVARARGWVLWELGDAGAAVAIWQEQPEALLGHPELLTRMASHFQSTGATHAEQAWRERMTALSAGGAANRTRLGDLYLAQGLTQEALAQWEAALKDYPHLFDLLIRMARVRLAQGDTEAGIARLIEASDLRPIPNELTLILADWLRGQGRTREALSLYWPLYQAMPREPRVRTALLELAGDPSAEPEARRAAARIALDSGRTDLAVPLLAAQVLSQAGDSESRVLLADLYFRAGRLGEAEALLTTAQPPLGRADHLRLLANLQRQLGNRESLADTLGRLAQLESADAAVARERGLLLVLLGRMGEAEQALAPLSSRTGSDPELALALAQVDLVRNRRERAETHLKEVLDKQPDQPEAHRLLRRLYEDGRRWEELSHELEYAIGKSPQSVELRESIVTAYLRAFTAGPARPHYDALRSLDARRARLYSPYFP